MFRKLVRALLVTAFATVAAIVTIRWFDDEASTPARGTGTPEVDADALDDAEREALLRELEAQI